jgi:Phytanoyl-CoA dioxygenase (PhyH)
MRAVGAHGADPGLKGGRTQVDTSSMSQLHSAPVRPQDLLVDPSGTGLIERYERYGVVVVRGGIPAAKIGTLTTDLAALIVARLHSLGDDPDPQTDVDALYDRLCARDRKHGGELYDIARHIGSFYDLIRCDEVLMTVAALMPPGALPSMPFPLSVFYHMRPGEDQRLFEWHQDYTYNVMGLDAVSVWFTLTPVDERTGALIVVPGSHRWPIAAVERFADEWVQGSGGGGRIFEYRDLDVGALEAASIAIPLEAGDVIYFNARLWHRSGTNRANRTRWTVSPRFCNLLNPEVVARGWHMGPKPGGGIRFAFRDVHPELSR